MASLPQDGPPRCKSVSLFAGIFDRAMGSQGASSSIMNKSRILIVDDDASISKLVALLLTRTGRYEVFVENRPFAAKAAATNFHPDLILLDVDMPGLDGGQVAAGFRADPRFAAVPIVFITSLMPPSEAGQDAVMRGGMPFLSKPVNPGALERTIKRLLGKECAVPS